MGEDERSQISDPLDKCRFETKNLLRTRLRLRLSKREFTSVNWK